MADARLKQDDEKPFAPAEDIEVLSQEEISYWLSLDQKREEEKSSENRTQAEAE